MNKRFRCGRVMLTKDGKVKKLDLDKGGGSRFCDWFSNDMNFDDILHQLINIFNLNDSEYETSLYDFQLRPLDINQYDTFLEYIYNNGLNCNSTIIYLCTHEVDNNNKSKKLKSSTTTLTSTKKISTLSEASSSTTLIEYKPIIKNEFDSDQEQIYPYSSDYSFKNSIDDLMTNIRHLLINQNNIDEILIKLFEYICIIYGYVCTIINRLNEKVQEKKNYFQLINRSEIILYSQNLNDFYNICELTQTLIDLNKTKFDHIQQFSIINDLFIRFYQNLKILRNHWFECIKHNNKSYEIPSSSEEQIEMNIETSNQENLETVVLFQYLLNCCTELVNVMCSSRLSTFRTMVNTIIADIKSLRSIINLHNYQSLCQAKQVVNSLKNRYTKKFNSDAFTSHEYGIDKSVKQIYQKTLRAICDLIISLTQYQQQINETNPTNNLNQPSTSLSIISQEQSENLNIDNHRQTDIASYSSFRRSSPLRRGASNYSSKRKRPSKYGPRGSPFKRRRPVPAKRNFHKSRRFK